MSKDEYLITDAPLKALTIFAMPMILGSFFQQVYNMADSIIVGQFVGSSDQLFDSKHNPWWLRLLFFSFDDESFADT